MIAWAGYSCGVAAVGGADWSGAGVATVGAAGLVKSGVFGSDVLLMDVIGFLPLFLSNPIFDPPGVAACRRSLPGSPPGEAHVSVNSQPGPYYLTALKIESSS